MSKIVKSAEKSKSKKENPKYNSDETVSAEEIGLSLTSPDVNMPPTANSETKVKSDDYSKGKQIISISSDSEYENAEQKNDNALMWKLRPSKKCSKYLPKEVQVKHEVDWLQKRQAPLKSISLNDLEFFEENMSSMEVCFYLGGNEHSSGCMSSGTNCMAKHSSNIPNPSILIPSFIPGQKPLSAEEVPKQWVSLRPRLVQDTLSKL